MAIAFTGLPDYDSPEFQSYIKGSAQAPDELDSVPQQCGDNVSENTLPESIDRQQRSTYASFGDGGTTATVSGYGAIMRVTKYLEGADNPSKMLGLEFSGGTRPYFVESRAEYLQEESPFPHSGFGLRIMNFDNQDRLEFGTPKLEFLNDRWPQNTYTVRSFNVRVRSFCQKGIVIQRLTVFNGSESLAKLQLGLNIDFSMHAMDYMRWVDDEELKLEHGPHHHSVLLTGEPKPEEGQNSVQAGVVVGLFQNGQSQKLSSEATENSSNLTRPIPLEHILQASETLELTAAFRLGHLNCNSSWRDFILPVSDVDTSQITQKQIPTLDQWPFPQNEVLSWHLRRNLEHILSVCSIPITQNVIVNVAKEEEDYPISLTCGDVGDHRVSVPGSFFAFKYLLSMYGQLRSSRLDGNQARQAAQLLRSRIRKTCKGHLQWISDLGRDRAFTSNFWVDGNPIGEQNISTDVPLDSPANLPMQILKVTEYLTVFKEQTEFIFVAKWLPPLVKSWFQCLKDTKNPLATTWRHLPEGPDIATYRLSDHVWIWKALQSIEQLISDVQAAHHSSPHASMESILELRNCLSSRKTRGNKAEFKLEFTADELRKQILRRFTLENDVSKKRMLSVTRSAQATRYLFHSRDTVLYYGLEWGFFKDETQSTSELWQLLVESQAVHDEGNNELQWDNPLRYALAVLMGTKGHQIDRNYTCSDMTSYAKRVLTNSSSENGLFPGQIDETTKQPTLFDRERFRDFYFHASFEIPFVLLRAESDENKVHDEPEQLDVTREAKASDFVKEVRESEVTLRRSGSPARDLQFKDHPIRRTSVVQSYPLDRFQSRHDANENWGLTAVLDVARNTQLDSRAIHIARSLKRRMPYAKFVDLTNIVEMPEEWLYDYPQFLDFQPPTKKEEAVAILKETDGIIAKYMEKKAPNGDKSKLSFDDIFNAGEVPMEFSIVDVPKGKKQRKREMPEPVPLSYQGFHYTSLWYKLREKRSVSSAKKRLIYLGPGDCNIAALCYLASFDLEREHISQFFDRHATSREFIIDDTTVASNSWETELHFSFYELVKGDAKTRTLSPIRAAQSRRCCSLKEDSHISEAAISFRIVGDFFDRYWTCHVIESFSNCENETFQTVGNQAMEHWQQRKVLELILFERILSKVRKGANDIIGAIEKGAAEKASVEETYLFGNLRFEDRSIKDLQEILQILVVLKNSFASILEIIDLWKDRESTRGQDRPRWTRNDEQKYRRSINRRLAAQERCIRDLRNQHARIEFLIDLVSSAQEAIRSARSLHEAENIRLFTYVTIFFLPVGLASSLFSMGQIPEHSVIITMIITAFIALFITGIVLYCILTFSDAATDRIAHQPLKRDKRNSGDNVSGRIQSKIKDLRQRIRPSKEPSKKKSVKDIEAGES